MWPHFLTRLTHLTEMAEMAELQKKAEELATTFTLPKPVTGQQLPTWLKSSQTLLNCVMELGTSDAGVKRLTRKQKWVLENLG